MGLVAGGCVRVGYQVGVSWLVSGLVSSRWVCQGWYQVGVSGLVPGGCVMVGTWLSHQAILVTGKGNML